MGVSKLTFRLNNSEVLVPLNWEDIKISASFGQVSLRPEIETERFTFVNEAAKIIRDYVNAGLSGGVGIFEGVPASMHLYDQNTDSVIFDGYIDLTEEFEIIDPQFKGDNPVQVIAKFVSDANRGELQTVIDGVSIPFLESIGVFSDRDYVDLPFIIEAQWNPVDVAVTVIGIYILEQAIEDAISRIAAAIASIAGVAGSGVTGPISAAIMAIALIAIEIALALALIVLIIQLSFDLVNLLLSPVRNHKTTPLKTLIEKSLNHFDYELVTNITDLDDLVYLPSKPFSDSTELATRIFPEPVTVKKGIPKVGDFGYFISECLEIVTRLFNARIDIIDNTVYIFNASDPFWKQTASYTLPDVLLPTRGYNTQDLRQTNIMSFLTDPSDSWTIENYTGTAYEIKTDPIKVNNVKRVAIRGINEITIPLALATVKSELNNLEKILKIFTDSAAFLLGALKKGQKLRNILSRRVGMMKSGGANHSMAKIVLLKGGQIPLDHRDTLSAKALFDTYYKSISFVDDEDNAQRVLYENVEIPFTLTDYQKVIKNSNFTTAQGDNARFKTLEWTISADTATANYEVQEKYTNNLKETKIEATL